MADFSHLAALIYKPALVARLEADGECVTDEMLLEIYKRISPPLLGPSETAVINALLSRRRGRRPSRRVPSLRWLSRKVAGLHRPDIHPIFLERLSNRIAAPKGFTELERARRFRRGYSRTHRDILIRGLYRQFRKMIRNDPLTIKHDVLGTIHVPAGISSHPELAAKMVHDVLRDRLLMTAPAERTIIKIGSMRH